jgi:hypothetical protein|tara:strand:+ start:30691 stop:31158 length:468 start_codon:yes stop_codon:yes gene_type:complete
MAKDTEKQYNELKKKVNLPDFKDIDFEFEISDLEETRYLLRAIIRRIAEKLNLYCTLIEEILQPDASNLYAMHETRFFDENDKKKMYDLYTKLMNSSRKSIEVSLRHDEKGEASFINDFHNEWKDLKKELIKYVGRMKDSWKILADIKEDIGYLG